MTVGSFSRTLLFGLGAVVAMAGLAPVAAFAQSVKVVAFAGASNWPYWVAQEKGFFKKEGLEVSLDITPNSVAWRAT
jgi:ABC-type nitrate/sulfonate/bicarbonate transport system substrate-binding protein